MPAKEQENLEVLLAEAIHTTGAPFSIFSHRKWKNFFRQVCPSFKLPTSEAIRGPLQDKQYIKAMSKVLKFLQRVKYVIVSLDEATNLNHESIQSVLICTPQGYLMEHLMLELKRETSQHLTAKILSFA